MIDYKLALALKDAGFQYSQKKIRMNKYDRAYKTMPKGRSSIEFEFAPSLSELIQAVRNSSKEHTYFSLVYAPILERWESEFANEIGLGKTSEEAVGNLRLKLNTK